MSIGEQIVNLNLLKTEVENMNYLDFFNEIHSSKYLHIVNEWILQSFGIKTRLFSAQTGLYFVRFVP